VPDWETLEDESERARAERKQSLISARAEA
jgi:hypothetical protein